MFKKKQTLITNKEEESVQLAKSIAAKIQPHHVLAISGNLGAGKSFFCREIIKELCGQDTIVTSPTFNLLQIYDSKKFTEQEDIYHFDLYRLKSFDEIYELGIEDALISKICFIEWPEIVQIILPKNTIYMNIEIINQDQRKITIIQS